MNCLTPQQLGEELAMLSNWQLERQGRAITRVFVLSDFMQAYAFMTHIAFAAEKHNLLS